MKRLLLLVFLSPFVLAFLPSCKHPKTESKVTITVIDTSDAPVYQASVMLDVPRDTPQTKPLKEGFPLLLLTDQNGKVSRDFDNGIVLKVSAAEGSMISKTVTVVLDPGETEDRTLVLDRKK
jgi:hypothetical protein